jgi:hypothetical protein
MRFKGSDLLKQNKYQLMKEKKRKKIIHKFTLCQYKQVSSGKVEGSTKFLPSIVEALFALTSTQSKNK